MAGAGNTHGHVTCTFAKQSFTGAFGPYVLKESWFLLRPRTLTCYPETRRAQRITLIRFRDDEQPITPFVLHRIDRWQLQREVPSLRSVWGQRAAISTQLLDTAAVFEHGSEHHFVLSSPLDGEILEGQELRVKAGQRDRASHYTKDTFVFFCGANESLALSFKDRRVYGCLKWWGKEESYPDKCRCGGNRAAALCATAPPPAEATAAPAKRKEVGRKFPFSRWKTESPWWESTIYLFHSLLGPRFLCLTSPTPSQTHEEIFEKHVLACWAIPAHLFIQQFSNRHYTEYENTSSVTVEFNEVRNGNSVASKADTFGGNGRSYNGDWSNLFDFLWGTHPQAVEVGGNRRVSPKKNPKTHIDSICLLQYFRPVKHSTQTVSSVPVTTMQSNSERYKMR